MNLEKNSVKEKMHIQDHGIFWNCILRSTGSTTFKYLAWQDTVQEYDVRKLVTTLQSGNAKREE